MTDRDAPRARHVGCPGCGAPLGFPEGRRTTSCPACGGRALLLLGDGAARERIVANVDADGAIARVRAAWSKSPVDPALPSAARFDAPEPVLVPLFEVEALQATLLVQKLGTQQVRSGHLLRDEDGTPRYVDDEGREIPEHEYYRTRTVDKRETRVVLRTELRSGPAGGPASWRLDGIDLAKLRAEPSVRFVPWEFDESARGATVLPIRRSAADALGSGITGSAEDRLAAEVRFVYVPLWLVRCRTGLRTWTYVVDGVAGRILAGRAPESPRRGALTAGVVAAFLGFPIGKAIAGFAEHGAQALAVVASVFASHLGIVAAFGVLVWFLLPLSVAWSEFRYRGEVDFGPDGPRVVKLAHPRTTWVDRLMERAFELISQSIVPPDRSERSWPW